MIAALNTTLALIEQLSARNRRERCVECELQLVELRRRAAREMRSLDACPVPTPAPRTSAPDLFAGERGLPEITGEALNADSLAAGILNHGALLVRGLFSAEQLARLRSELGDTAPAQETPGLGCSPHILFELLEIYRDCGLLDVVREYLGEEPLLFGERTKLRQHHAGRDRYAAIPWHQDVNFFGAQAWAVNCWAAVTPCGEDNPGVGLIPRRTEQRHGWDGSRGLAPLDYGNSLPGGMIETLARDHPVVTPVLQPGDALLFDEMTIHGTAQKPWKLQQQVVTISWFFACSRFPAWGTPLAV